MEYVRIPSPPGLDWDNPYSERIPEIREDEWEYSPWGEPLTTSRATACTLVAVYDAVRHRGYLGHFRIQIDMATHRPFLDMLTAIRADRPSDRLEAWVSGASTLDMPHMDEQHLHIYHELIELNRSDTINRLGHAGIVGESIREDWLKDNERITGVIFDAANGVVSYGVNRLE